MENFRLKVFRAVARRLSFSRAAEELLISQPAVTQQVRALEEEIGVRLFDRTRGRVRLTAAGERLREHAERLRGMAEEALADVVSVGSALRGELTLAASQTIGQYVLPRLIAAFQRENPGVRVLYQCVNTEEALARLQQRAVQMALIEGPARQKGLRVEAFLQDRLLLIAAARHPWAGRQINARELLGEPLLMREVGSGSRRVMEQALARCGMRSKQLTIAMALNSTEAQLSAAEAGLGVTFVSQWAAQKHLALGAVREIPVRGLTLARRFSLALPTGPNPAGASENFRRFLLQRAGEVLREAGPAAQGAGDIL